MTDMSGTQLTEPNQIDWDNFNPQSGTKYQAPPDALDASGKSITYFAQLPSDLGDVKRLKATQEGLRNYDLGPLTLVKNNSAADGYSIRFYSASVKSFTSRTGEPLNVNAIGKVLKAAGVGMKPQKTVEYDAAVKLASGRVIPVTLDWEARNRDTGEEVKGFENFPVDATTGKRKAILKAGDILPDGRVVQSDVLFANARVRYVQDPNRK